MLLLKNIEIDDVTLELATELLRFPYLLGKHNNKDVTLHKGNGLYIKYDSSTYSCDTEINLDEAIKLIEQSKKSKIKSITDGKKNIILEMVNMDHMYLYYKMVNISIKKFLKVLRLKK